MFENKRLQESGELVTVATLGVSATKALRGESGGASSEQDRGVPPDSRLLDTRVGYRWNLGLIENDSPLED